MYNYKCMPANKLFTKKQRGFTLVELLIVIMIIGVLAGMILTVLNSQGIRQKSRDNTRIADLKKVQSALELYFADFRRYPAAGNISWVRITGSEFLSTTLVPTYINALPTDPTPVGVDDNPCGNPTNLRYNYRTNGAGSVYLLTAMMEVPTSNDGHECHILNSWRTNAGCSTNPPATSDFCYGVENP